MDKEIGSLKTVKTLLESKLHEEFADFLASYRQDLIQEDLKNKVKKLAEESRWMKKLEKEANLKQETD